MRKMSALTFLLLLENFYGADPAQLTWQSPFWRKWIMWEVLGWSFG
jgi:hypothetical protein